MEVWCNLFVIGQARSAAIAGVKEQCAGIHKCTNVRAIAPDDGDVGIARLVIAHEHIERTRALEQQRKIVRGLR